MFKSHRRKVLAAAGLPVTSVAAVLGHSGPSRDARRVIPPLRPGIGARAGARGYEDGPRVAHTSEMSPPLRRLHNCAGRAVVVAAAAVGTSLVGGCGADKLSAGETEVKLREQNPTWQSIRCVEEDDVWDFGCTYAVVVDDGSTVEENIGVRVDDENITDRSAP